MWGEYVEGWRDVGGFHICAMTFTFSTGAAQGVNTDRRTNCAAVWVNEDATLLHTHTEDTHTLTHTCAERFVPLHCDYLSRLALHISLCLNKNCGRPPLSCNLFVYCFLARPTPTPAAVVTLALASITWPPTTPAPPPCHTLHFHLASQLTR